MKTSISRAAGRHPPNEFIAAMNSRLPLLDVAGVRSERLGQSLYVERLSQSFTALIVKGSW